MNKIIGYALMTPYILLTLFLVYDLMRTVFKHGDEKIKKMTIGFFIVGILAITGAYLIGR